MKKWQKVILLVLAFAVAILGSAIVTMQLTRREQTPVEAKTAEIGAYLDTLFIDDYDEDKLADAAAAAMVEATGDRWSYYLTAEEKSSYDEQMRNAYVGIGVTITAQEALGGMRIEAVTAGGPAEEAGILVGDIITEVEGERTLDLGMTGTRTKVRGEEGTFVTLTILRGEESFPLSVERRSIQTPVATYEMLNGQIGYLKIANFDSRCAEETNAAMDELIAQGAQALIFDVRYNGGGYKDELVKVLDKILPEGILFQSKDYKGTKQADRSDAACIKLPMAVLVNQDSYSAAEFFAAAIQEYNWAYGRRDEDSRQGQFPDSLYTLRRLHAEPVHRQILHAAGPQSDRYRRHTGHRNHAFRRGRRKTLLRSAGKSGRRTITGRNPRNHARNSLDIPIFARYNVC